MLANFLNTIPVLAQNRGEDAGFFMVLLGVMCVAIVVGLGIQAIVCWYLSNCLKAIPEEHRKQQPGMVWLLMIPLVGIVWNFFVYPKISESYKSYFDSIGRTDMGDCGRGLGLTFSILVCTTIIPYLGSCTGLVAFILWIIILVKFSSLKGQVLASTGPQMPPTV
jgi:hypothetical protein